MMMMSNMTPLMLLEIFNDPMEKKVVPSNEYCIAADTVQMCKCQYCAHAVLVAHDIILVRTTPRQCTD
jgi:hypothetical protein